MLSLSAEDVFFLVEIAATRTLNQEEREETKLTLIRGFEKYADLGLVDYFNGNREKMIRDRADWLIENIDKAGQDSADAFGSEAGRDAIIRIVLSMNVPKRNAEDLSDEIIAKFWRHKHAEKYNPLKAPWGHHVRNSVRTCVASFWAARKRQPDEIGVSMDQKRPQCSGTEDDMHLEPYERDQTAHNPENIVMLGEFMAEFEQFLQEEKPFRTAIFHGYKEQCTLLPPGIPEIQITEPYTLFIRAKGRDSFRVVDPEWDSVRSVMVSVDKLKVYKTTNPDGSVTETKFQSNPSYKELAEPLRIERTPYDVYKLLIRGMQVTEIATHLNVGESTAHNWVRRLEELFAEYWSLSDTIPEEKRQMAEPVYKCPKCGGFSEEGEMCLLIPTGAEVICGESFRGVKKEIHRMNIFPWGPVRGNPDIKRRADQYRVGMSAQACYM